MKRIWLISILLVGSAALLSGVVWWFDVGSLVTGRTYIRPAVGSKLAVTAFGYSSTHSQTDSSPCITAAGTRVREGIIATNFLPLGTIVSIDEKPYIVEDRMNARYTGRYIDIWFPSRAAALEHGKKQMVLTIEGYGTPGQALTLDNDTAKVVEPSVSKRASLRFVATIQKLNHSLRATVNPKEDEDCLATE